MSSQALHELLARRKRIGSRVSFNQAKEHALHEVALLIHLAHQDLGHLSQGHLQSAEAQKRQLVHGESEPMHSQRPDLTPNSLLDFIVHLMRLRWTSIPLVCVCGCVRYDSKIVAVATYKSLRDR